jgi:hypothetical protein
MAVVEGFRNCVGTGWARPIWSSLAQPIFLMTLQLVSAGLRGLTPSVSYQMTKTQFQVETDFPPLLHGIDSDFPSSPLRNLVERRCFGPMWFASVLI